MGSPLPSEQVIQSQDFVLYVFEIEVEFNGSALWCTPKTESTYRG